MIRRIVLGVLVALFALPALAQTAPAPLPKVRLETAAGLIVLEIDAVHAPVTAANFLRYVDQKRFDGTVFYRAVGTTEQGFVQGGAQNDLKRLLPPIKHEPTSVTGLTHKDGTISMARYAPGSATADFFICLGAMPSMDADPKLPGDNQGFAAFGQVVEGMDVIRTILTARRSPTLGEGVMKGQMLAPTVTIISARRVP